LFDEDVTGKLRPSLEKHSSENAKVRLRRTQATHKPRVRTSPRFCEGHTFLEEVNPGNQVKGTLVFDVPKGTKLASIVLHESFYTEGVRVPLQ
jgi:hypothetical protein